MSRPPRKRMLCRGEAVFIVKEDVPMEERNMSTLGASVREATTFVEYPDGEHGFVKPGELTPL